MPLQLIAVQRVICDKEKCKVFDALQSGTTYNRNIFFV